MYEVLQHFTPQVQMASIDEAYLDMTGTERLHGPPLKAAHELHQMMKAETRGFVPIILLTARTDFETRRRGHKAGADDFLNKPINPDELAIRIDAMLRIKSLTEQLEAANAKLAEMADTDGLTGVSNRRRLDHMLDLEHERSRRYKRPMALLIIDIDFFKKINDGYGHAIGDSVLKTVASGIREMLRRSDVCGRYGGEEFVVIAPELSTEGAVVLAERIQRWAGERFVVAVERLMGLILVAVAVEMFIQGWRQLQVPY